MGGGGGRGGVPVEIHVNCITGLLAVLHLD